MTAVQYPMINRVNQDNLLMKDLSINENVLKAKTLLKGRTVNTTNTSSLYDDFGSIINKTLTDRAACPIDLLESYIDNKEPAQVFNEEDSLNQTRLATNNLNLFEAEYVRDDAADPDEEFEIPIPNCLHMTYFFEQAGIGLAREDIYKISLSMKYLVYNYPLSSARFWGKIFGTEKSYYITEVEFREGEGDEENGEEDEEEENAVKDDDDEDEDGPTEEDNFPVITWKPPPPIIKEDHHSGVNKYVYFVCNEPGESWVKLPHVTPEEIVIARQINKFFTGNLEAKLITYPPFAGNESNYLRAQIARISASTLISPAGYFIFDEEEDDDEEEELHESYMQNPEFEGLSIRELVDPSMASWAHHSQYILPQGRCSWYDPYEKPEDDFEEEEEEEEEKSLEPVAVPETGPNLLASVGDDKGIGAVSAWSTYPSSHVLPEYSVAVARSNIWPGAYAFAKQSKFENVYIGWGKKYDFHPYAPPAPPIPQDEYTVIEEVQEQTDPTIEDEKARDDKMAANKAAEEMEEEDMEEEDDDEA